MSALFYASTLYNPLIVGLHALGEVVVFDHIGRHIMPHTADDRPFKHMLYFSRLIYNIAFIFQIEIEAL
jgi:hypothetical protein